MENNLQQYGNILRDWTLANGWAAKDIRVKNGESTEKYKEHLDKGCYWLPDGVIVEEHPTWELFDSYENAYVFGGTIVGDDYSNYIYLVAPHVNCACGQLKDYTLLISITQKELLWKLLEFAGATPVETPENNEVKKFTPISSLGQVADMYERKADNLRSDAKAIATREVLSNRLAKMTYEEKDYYTYLNPSWARTGVVPNQKISTAPDEKVLTMEEYLSEVEKAKMVSGLDRDTEEGFRNDYFVIDEDAKQKQLEWLASDTSDARLARRELRYVCSNPDNIPYLLFKRQSHREPAPRSWNGGICDLDWYQNGGDTAVKFDKYLESLED